MEKRKGIDSNIICDDKQGLQHNKGDGMVSITEKAVTELKNILEKEKKQGFGLRISIAGMGCGGPQYMLALDEKPGEGDEVIETSGIKIFLSEQTKTVLDGSEIDYVETPQGAGFTINNPDTASSGCGPSCGGCH